MVNYKNGKIYKILDLTNDNFYIGSTTKEYLSQRLEKHRTSYKYYLKGNKHKYSTSFDILTNEDYKILLVENFSCVSKDELRQREQYWIDKLKCDKMVNKYRAFRTEEDDRTDKREWSRNNKDKIKEYYENNKEEKLKYRKEYYENNKEEIAKKDKIYKNNNKELIADRRKKYYEKNKELIVEKMKEKIQCERCNAIVRKNGLTRHQRTKTCINALPHGLICELAE